MSSDKNKQRRLLLKAGVASMVAPRIVFASTPTNPEVVIIGAGIAGLEAAKTLHAKGISFVVLEASNRIGGRVHTDNDIFGVPFDMHAHWVNYPTANPLIEYGQNNGFDIYRDPRVSKSFVGNREATEEEMRDQNKTYKLFTKKIKASAYTAKGDDDNARTALGEDFFKLPWGYTVAANNGPWSMAQNSKDYSPTDWWNSEGGGQHFCREGYGTLVAHYGRDVPVSLGAWVTEIDWSGDGVKVISSAGILKAKAAIVTVSVGVLANNRIKFTPELPQQKLEAIDGIDMAVMNYIGLQFTDDVFGFGADVYVDQQQHDENGVGYMANMSDTNLVYSYVGGDQAKALENENMDVAIAYSLDGMKSMLGNDIEKKFIKGYATTTGKIPFWDGSYSTAKPGKQPMRAALRQTLAKKLLFSGEACSQYRWASVDGGLNAGKASANEAARYVKNSS
ncbi:MAG: NAD(P)/FAD-dependent oxidoreductase [Gammaproteobacteria bacterium]|nr:NAD(P)/FAD-dependent oxidoreductase [Gammaproteobacteria bacterium]